MRDIGRRDFFLTSATALAALALPRDILAAADSYDILIRSGRVIDPASRLDAVRDVAIKGGRIAAVSERVTGTASETIDARGKLVVPGLIDIHTHAARSTDNPPLLLQDGVTGWIDGGSQGADHIDETVAVARTSPQIGRVLVNIGRAGILSEGDTIDLARADVGLASDAIAHHRDFVVGVKARLSSNLTKDDYEVLKRAQQAASTHGVPVMIHMGQTTSPLTRLLPILKRGDIVTHMFAPPPNGILDDAGRILPVVREARKRGVWFDVGNGVTGHLRWDIVETVMKQDFWPDAISTDWNATSRTNAVVNLPNCLSKMLGYGMKVPDVIACATVNSARMFPAFKDRGVLKVGAPADIALLELRDGDFEFEDNYGGKTRGHQRLFPSATVLGGRRVTG
jgi:dihydroorotase